MANKETGGGSLANPTTPVKPIEKTYTIKDKKKYIKMIKEKAQ